MKNEKKDRLDKLEKLTKRGINPYPARSKRTHRVNEVIERFSELEKTQKKITLSGRLRAKRTHGSLSFGILEDQSGGLQVVFSKKEIDSVSGNVLLKYNDFVKLIDIGDFVEVRGSCFVTQKGEKSLKAEGFKILAKSLKPLPDKWHGLKNEEERYRKRYLDLLMNPELREIFYKKTRFWENVRKFMKDKGFFEVETPTLETTTGGAEANPFKTRHNDLDLDVYLRISVGELWQKRLMAAGFERTFEIGRVYRNEGTSADHLQEFTNMEFYWAYADYRDGMDITRELYQTIARNVFGTLKFEAKGHKFDLEGEWPKIDYVEEIKKQTGIDVLAAKKEAMEKKLNELKIKYDGDNRERLTDTLWKYCRKNIAGPAFLIGHPKLISPLSKTCENEPGKVERFQILIAGVEAGNGYSELNNPLEQKKRFEEQKKLLEKGDSEAMMPDWEFTEMLEYGMPPTCGFGFGERFFSLLIGKPIRETALFPLVKPKLPAVKPKREIIKSRNARQHAAHSTQHATHDNLGINYAQAQKLLDQYISDPVTKLHMVETEAIMRSLARHFGENEEAWGIIGLLHDIDWDICKNDVKNHTIKAVEILKNAGATDFLIESAASHAWGNKECGEYPDKQRTTKLQRSLAAAETMTGIIIAAALVQPDKKLGSVKLSSLKKKFRQKSFAANCDREIIREIEQTGMKLDEFFEISLRALRGISDELGL